MDYMAAVENRRAREAAMQVYRDKVRQISLPMTTDFLLEKESEAKQAALTLFLDQTFIDKNNGAGIALGLELNETFQELMDKNEEASIKASTAVLEGLYSHVQEQMQSGTLLKPGWYAEYQEQMEELAVMFLTSPNLGDQASEVILRFHKEKETERRQILHSDERLSEKEVEMEEDREAGEEE